MKRGIELNGVANMAIMLELLNEKSPARMIDVDGQPIVYVKQEDLDTMKIQLKLLERYMIAYCQAVNAGVEAPQWHEVRDNPTKYPDNRESHGG